MESTVCDDRMNGAGLSAAGRKGKEHCFRRTLLCVCMLLFMSLLMIGVSSKAYAVTAGDTGYVNYTYLNLRKSASTGSAIVVKLSKNDTVTIVKVVSSKWYQVKAVHAGKTYSGYVSAQYITLNTTKTAAASATASNSTVGRTGYVNYTYLNLRKTASTKASLVVKLSKNDIVTIKKVVNSKWYQISAVHGGKVYSGYVSSQYITLNPVPSGKKIVYLTFDDGPGPYTAKLLTILKNYNAKATFFVTGQHSKYFSQIAAEAKQGHTVGLHCYTHDYSKVYTDENSYFTDLNKISDLVYKQTGTRSKLIRFPGGSSNTVSKQYCEGIMTTLTQDITALGYTYTDWNVSAGDAGTLETASAKTAAEVSANVIAGIQKRNVSVVLQHDVKSYSVDAVETILKWGIRNGYVFRAMTTSAAVHNTVKN